MTQIQLENGLYITDSTAEASAIVQADSTSQGFLPPRMTSIQRDAIVSPATGLTIFNTSTQDLEVFNGTAWLGVGNTIDTSNSLIEATAGEDLALRDYVYLNEGSGTWFKVDTDALPVKCGRIRGIVNETAILSTTIGSVCLLGEVAGFTGLTAWQPIYADNTISGGITQTRPSPVSGNGQVAIVEIGIAISSSNIVVMPQQGVQYMKRDHLLGNESIITIQHHSDPMGHKRRASAYIGSTVVGATIAEYTSTNQETDISLRKDTTSVHTYTPDQCSGGTAIAQNSFNSDFEANKAFDNINTSRWASNSTVGDKWIEYDFGVNKTIRRYTLREKDSGSVSNSPAGWEFQYYNGTSWISVDTQSSIIWTLGETKTFDIPTVNTAQRWRVCVNVAGAGDPVYSFSEIQMMEAEIFAINDKLTQTITIANNTDVGSVNLYLKKTGTPTGTLTIRLETLSGGDPSGTLVDANATATLAESSLGTSYAIHEIEFADTFALTAGTYAIVISTDRVASDTNYVLWCADTSSPSYAGGEMKSESGTVWSSQSADAIFTLLAPGTTFVEPALVGRWSGSTGDVAVRYDDGVDADSNIKTTFKNIIGAEADVTAVLEIV